MCLPMKRWAGVLAALFVLLAAAAPAVADDASLRAAGQSRDAQIEKLSARHDRAFRQFRRSGFRRSAGAIRVLRRLRGEFKLVARRVRAQQPTSAGGAEYKRLILLSIGDGVKGLELQGKAVRVARHRRLRRAAQLERRSNRYFDRADRREKAAIAAYDARLQP